MRYRSATVADSHGLPLNLERNKRTGERAQAPRTHRLRATFLFVRFLPTPPHRNHQTRKNSTLARSQLPLFSSLKLPLKFLLQNALLHYCINIS